MVIEWKEPPTKGNRRWSDVVAQIRTRPGEWAFVGNMTMSAAYKQARNHNLEIRVVNRSGSKADVYLRAPEED